MRLTIVADDNAVGVDGEFLSPLDLAQLDPNIHAVQWYGEYGEVEFRTRFENGKPFTPQNEYITDISPYQFALDAWTQAMDDQMQAGATPASGEIPVSEL